MRLMSGRRLISNCCASPTRKANEKRHRQALLVLGWMGGVFASCSVVLCERKRNEFVRHTPVYCYQYNDHYHSMLILL